MLWWEHHIAKLVVNHQYARTKMLQVLKFLSLPASQKMARPSKNHRVLVIQVLRNFNSPLKLMVEHGHVQKERNSKYVVINWIQELAELRYQLSASKQITRHPRRFNAFPVNLHKILNMIKQKMPKQVYGSVRNNQMVLAQKFHVVTVCYQELTEKS